MLSDVCSDVFCGVGGCCRVGVGVDILVVFVVVVLVGVEGVDVLVSVFVRVGVVWVDVVLVVSDFLGVVCVDVDTVVTVDGGGVVDREQVCERSGVLTESLFGLHLHTDEGRSVELLSILSEVELSESVKVQPREPLVSALSIE